MRRLILRHVKRFPIWIETLYNMGAVDLIGDQVLTVLREYGFPTLVCLWFMWRTERRLDALIEQQAQILGQQTQVLMCLVVLAKVLEVDLPHELVLPGRMKELP